MDSQYFETRSIAASGQKPRVEGNLRVSSAVHPALRRRFGGRSGYCDFINQIQAGGKYAVDVNADVARLCGPDVQFLQATPIESIDLPPHSVDVVMASNLLEHLSPQQCSNLFDRFDTVLKATGRVIVIQPNYFYSYRRYWTTHSRAGVFARQLERLFASERIPAASC